MKKSPVLMIQNIYEKCKNKMNRNIWELFSIDMLLFDNKREKSQDFMTMDCNIQKVSFRIFFCTKEFFFLLSFRLSFMQNIFMNKVTKCPNYIGSESIQLLRHCRDPVSYTHLTLPTICSV